MLKDFRQPAKAIALIGIVVAVLYVIDSRETSGSAGHLAKRKEMVAPAKAPRQVLEGYVKNGVIHLLEGELPDGTFVTVIRK